MNKIIDPMENELRMWNRNVYVSVCVVSVCVCGYVGGEDARYRFECSYFRCRVPHEKYLYAFYQSIKSTKYT